MPERLKKGVAVATVRSIAMPGRWGLREGDVITGVNSKRVIGLDQFASEAGKIRHSISLDVVRNGERLLLSIKLQQTPPKPKG